MKKGIQKERKEQEKKVRKRIKQRLRTFVNALLSAGGNLFELYIHIVLKFDYLITFLT